MCRHIQPPKALAFTRNPSDTSVSPATYTADGASDLVLLDQQRNIFIDGSDKKDVIRVNDDALTSQALYDYDVRGFAGNDNIDFRAALIQNSVINGNVGNDTLNVIAESISGSYFLGGKGNDTVTASDLSDGEINGNIGDDTVTVTTGDGGFNMYVGGGQGNDVVTISGNFTGSIIDGNKGKDIIEVLAGNHSGTSVNGGEDDDDSRVDELVPGFDQSLWKQIFQDMFDSMVVNLYWACTVL